MSLLLDMMNDCPWVLPWTFMPPTSLVPALEIELKTMK
jgi:hypothetical protein